MVIFISRASGKEIFLLLFGFKASLYIASGELGGFIFNTGIVSVLLFLKW